MRNLIVKTAFVIALHLSYCAALAANAQELKLEILNGHSGGGVLAAAVSADGKFALTGSEDWTALLWDLETGRQLRRFVGHEAEVGAVAFSKDGTLILTADDEGTAFLWETATGKRVRGFKELTGGRFVGHAGSITSAAISPDGKFVATAGEDKTARLWDAATGKHLFELKHSGRVGSITFSPDSKLLLTGGADEFARLFSTETGGEIKSFGGHAGKIMAAAYSPDGKRILTGGVDRAVRLWNAETAVEIKKIEFALPIFKVGFSPSGKSLFVAHRDPGYAYQGEKKFAVLREIDSGKEIWSAADEVFSFAFTPDEKKILILSEGEAKIVNLSEPNTRRALRGETVIVRSVAASPDARFLLTGSFQNTSALWNLTSGQMSQPWARESVGKAEDLRTVRFSADGKKIAFASGDGFGQNGDVQIYETETFRQLFKDSMDCAAVALSANGENVFCNALGRGGLLFNYEAFLKAATPEAKKAAVRAILEGGEGVLTDVAFSPDEKTIAASDEDNAVHLWDAQTGKIKSVLKDFPAPVWSVAFSPDGKTLATASGGAIDNSKIGIVSGIRANGVQFWSVETGERLEGFTKDYTESGIVTKLVGSKSVAYSPDGKYVAAGSFDGEVYLRDNRTKTLRQFKGHTDVVNSIGFARDADGKLLVVSGSSDSTTRIWNAETGEEICALVTFRDGNWAFVQTKTGRYDASNGGEITGIQWVFGNETIALNQLKDIYYTPNLLPRLLGYNNDPLRPVPELSNLKLFPKIVEQKLDEKNARLTVKLQNRGGGIGEVLVKINGKLAAPDARSERQKAEWNQPEMTIDFNLKGSAGFDPQAKNEIEIVTNNYDPAIKKGYIASKGADVIYLGNGADERAKPTLHAVVAGVSDYVGEQIDLNFAAKDAEDFARALGIGARRLFCPPENGNCADKVKIKLLTTNEKDKSKLPTKENIRAAFAEIAAAAKPEDVLVVYLSGHGASLTLDDADTYFYLAQDADKASKEALQNPEYRRAAAISSVELLEWLTQTEWRADQKGIDASKQVMILDTCAAGAFEGNLAAANKTKDLSADQIRALERLKDRSGFQILMGSAANQSSYEASQYGQGLLTYALLEGIKGAALQNQTRVETATLFDYAVNRVPKMDIAGGAGGLQQPRVFGATSIPIGLILTQADKDAIRLESVKPVLLRPRFSTGAEGDDDLNLIGALRRKFEEASEIKPRGADGDGGRTARLVYVDDDSFPGAYRVTGTYETDAGGQIIITPFLRKDGKTIANLPKVAGKDASDAAGKLLDAILKEL